MADARLRVRPGRPKLTRSVAALKNVDAERDVVLMPEVWDEATYVPANHPQEDRFVFSAMRHFAEPCGARA